MTHVIPSMGMSEHGDVMGYWHDMNYDRRVMLVSVRAGEARGYELIHTHASLSIISLNRELIVRLFVLVNIYLMCGAVRCVFLGAPFFIPN